LLNWWRWDYPAKEKEGLATQSTPSLNSHPHLLAKTEELRAWRLVCTHVTSAMFLEMRFGVVVVIKVFGEMIGVGAPAWKFNLGALGPLRLQVPAGGLE
jgi:hypothetical protein